MRRPMPVPKVGQILYALNVGNAARYTVGGLEVDLGSESRVFRPVGFLGPVEAQYGAMGVVALLYAEPPRKVLPCRPGHLEVDRDALVFIGHRQHVNHRMQKPEPAHQADRYRCQTELAGLEHDQADESARAELPPLTAVGWNLYVGTNPEILYKANIDPIDPASYFDEPSTGFEHGPLCPFFNLGEVTEEATGYLNEAITLSVNGDGATDPS